MKLEDKLAALQQQMNAKVGHANNLATTVATLDKNYREASKQKMLADAEIKKLKAEIKKVEAELNEEL